MRSQLDMGARGGYMSDYTGEGDQLEMPGEAVDSE